MAIPSPSGRFCSKWPMRMWLLSSSPPGAGARRHGPPELLAHPVMLNGHKVTLGINVLTSEIVSATINSLSNVAPEKFIDQAVFLRNQRGRRGPGAHVA